MNTFGKWSVMHLFYPSVQPKLAIVLCHPRRQSSSMDHNKVFTLPKATLGYLIPNHISFINLQHVYALLLNSFLLPLYSFLGSGILPEASVEMEDADDVFDDLL